MRRIAYQEDKSGSLQVASFLSSQLKRLLGYLRPYAFRFSVGVNSVAFVALAEGAVALMIKLAVDFVLIRPFSGSRLQIGTLAWNGRVSLPERLFPAADSHNVWTVFAFTLIILFFAKSLAE